MRRVALTLAFLALATMACNLPPGVPVTPTLAPSVVHSPTPTEVALLPSPSETPQPTFTPSSTFTETAVPTLEPSATNPPPPTATDTPLPALTGTPLPTATDTPLPTDTPPPTLTSTPPPTLTNAPPPTETPAPTLTDTALPTLTLVPSSTASEIPPPTLVPLAPTSPLPTLVKPLIGVTLVNISPTPVPGTAVNNATQSSSPVAVPPIIGTVIAVPPTLALNTGGLAPNLSLLQLPVLDSSGRVPLDFDTNPSGHRAVIDQIDLLTIDGIPYNANGKHAGKRFIQARWSPDGRWLAYTIQTPNAESGQLGWSGTLDDGLWVLDTATPNAEPQHVYRNHYEGPKDTQLRIVQNITWAPDNDAIMLTVRWPRGLKSVLVGKTIHADDRYQGLFDLIDYVNGAWLPNSQGYVAASPPGDHPALLGIVQRDISPDKIIRVADGAALHLWIQNPAQVAGGGYAFLGKPSATGQLENGATQLSLYTLGADGVPTAVSAALPGEVYSAAWNTSRTALLVVLHTDRGYETVVMTLDGQLFDFTAQAKGSPAVHWSH